MKQILGDWKRELLGVALTAMEAAWIAAWLLIIVYGAAPTHPALAMGAGVFAALYLISWFVRALDGLKLDSSAISVVVMILAAVSGLVFVRVHLYPGGSPLDFSWLGSMLSKLAHIFDKIPADAGALLAVFFIWWRGMSLGNRAYTFDRVGFSFRAGIVLLMWNAVAVAILGRAVPILGFAFTYFFFGLLAVGLARVYDLENQPESGGKVSTRFWLGAIVGGIVVVLGAALVFTQLLTVGNLQLVGRLLNPLWRVLGAAVSAVLYGIGLIFGPLLDWLIRFFRARIGPNVLPTEVPPVGTPAPNPELPAATPPAYLAYVEYVIIALFFIGVIALIAFSFRRMRARAAQRQRSEEREIEWEWPEPRKGIAGAVRAGVDRLAEILHLAGQFGLGQRFRAAISIRWIYANLLRLASERGSPRQASQTPYEFLASLYKTFPGFEPQVNSITEAYVRSHYGEVPTVPGELEQIRAYWDLIRESPQAATP